MNDEINNLVGGIETAPVSEPTVPTEPTPATDNLGAQPEPSQGQNDGKTNHAFAQMRNENANLRKEIEALKAAQQEVEKKGEPTPPQNTGNPEMEAQLKAMTEQVETMKAQQAEYLRGVKTESLKVELGNLAQEFKLSQSDATSFLESVQSRGLDIWNLPQGLNLSGLYHSMYPEKVDALKRQGFMDQLAQNGGDVNSIMLNKAPSNLPKKTASDFQKILEVARGNGDVKI